MEMRRYTSLSPPCHVSKVMYSMKFLLDIDGYTVGRDNGSLLASFFVRIVM